MQREVLRSDARSVIPSAANDHHTLRTTFRSFIGTASDSDSEEDLYETLLNKGLVEKNRKQRGTEDDSLTADSLTASCTESYSSWNGSFHDSFAGHDVLQQVQQLPFQLSPQSRSIPGFSNVATSPRRRRRRRGSIDPVIARPPPALALKGPATDPELLESTPPSSDGVASSADITTTTNSIPRLRLPRRKHGSFLDSSSTSCCLQGIVEEETENTISSGTTPDIHQQDVDDIFRSPWESEEIQNHSQRRVTLGHAEFRFYNVILDQCGGYGLDGKAVPCPLTLDWSYDREYVVRKPAILFGHSSYFQQVKLRPISVDDRRARLGVLNHLRQSKVIRWEYQSLLHQMAVLQPKGRVPDRWNESSEDELDYCHLRDRAPRMPVRGFEPLYEDDQDDFLETDEGMIITWKRNREMVPSVCGIDVVTPSVRGIDMPVVPMQWIDHDSQPQLTAKEMDSLKPLAPLWLDIQSHRREQDQHQIDESDFLEPREPCTRRDLPTIPSLWLSDIAVGVPGDQLSEPDEDGVSPVTDFRPVPFQSIVEATVKNRSFPPDSSQGTKSKDWKRSPPCRSHCRMLVPFDRNGSEEETAPGGSESARCQILPQAPGMTRCTRSSAGKVGGDSDTSILLERPGKFRPLPFEDVEAEACLLTPSLSSIRESSGVSASSVVSLSLQAQRSLDEIVWRRNVLSTSLPSVVAPGDDSISTEDCISKSHNWLDEVSKIRGTNRTMRKSESTVKALLPTQVKCVPQVPSAQVTSAGFTMLPCVVAATQDLQLDGIVHGDDDRGTFDCQPKGSECSIQSNPLLCLYQDVPTSQKGSGSQRVLPNIPFVWLPAFVSEETNTMDEIP